MWPILRNDTYMVRSEYRFFIFSKTNYVTSIGAWKMNWRLILYVVFKMKKCLSDFGWPAVLQHQGGPTFVSNSWLSEPYRWHHWCVECSVFNVELSTVEVIRFWIFYFESLYGNFIFSVSVLNFVSSFLLLSQKIGHRTKRCQHRTE